MLSIALLAAAQAPASVVTPTVVGASLFKNGYAMVTRQVNLSGPQTLIRELPSPALGTLWLTADTGVKVRRLALTTEVTKSQVPAASFDEFLRANIGKTAGIRTVNLGLVTGKVKAVNGEFVTLEDAGSTVVFSRSEIRLVSIENAATTRTVEGSQRVLRVDADGKGKLYLMGLERGLTWAPAYSLDVTDPKTLTLQARATVLNDLATFNNIELSFVTGFPNVPWAAFQEPLLSNQSVDLFVNMMGGIGAGPGGPGFGARREMMTQNIAADAGGWAPPPTSSDQIDDLFFYRYPGFTMKPGDRQMVFLFEAKCPYQSEYVAEIPLSGAVDTRYQSPDEGGPIETWHTIRFTNASGKPLTTAVASVSKKGELIGQDSLKYTSSGAEATVKMSKALDVRVDYLEDEVERQRRAREVPNSSTAWDLITLEGTLQIENRKGIDIQMKVSKPVIGEVVSSEGDPKIRKDAKGLREVNPNSKLEWSLSLKAGEKRTIKFRYQTFIRVS